MTELMTDPIFFISLSCAAIAILLGLLSRNLATAAVSGFFLGLIQAGLIALTAMQKGATTVAELPYARDGIDYAMRSGYLGFANARFLTYLAALALGTMVLMVAAFLVRWIVLGICGLAPARRAAD